MEPGTKKYRKSLEARKSKEVILPRYLQKKLIASPGTRPNTLTLAHKDSFQTSDL